MNVERVGIHESVGAVFPPQKLREALADLGPALAIVGDDPADLAACDGIVTFEHRDTFLETVPWVHSIQAGVDRFPIEAFERAGVALTNSTGIHGQSVGEMVVGYMIALSRDLPRYVRQSDEHEWTRPAWDRPFAIGDERLCVVGLGTLGRGIATRAAALGTTVTGVKRTVEPIEGVETVHPPEDLPTAVEDARFVALAVPLTDETRHLVGRTELEAMRDDAYLINVARGQVVDERVLIETLRAGEIAGAALDVFATEPLPDDSPLWDLETVIVTPHVAGSIRSYYEDIARLVRENVQRVGADRPLKNAVVRPS